MPFPIQHKYLSLSGPMRGGESWSFGLRLQGDFAYGDQAAEEAILADLQAAIDGWWTTVNVIGSAAWLQTIKYNGVGVDGKYLQDYTVRYDYPTPRAGNGAVTHPNQIALVATLETGLTRGLAHRGRIFLPAPPIAVGTDGKISQASAQGCATTVANLINAINAVPAAGRVIVASAVREGAWRPVTGVSIGRTLDTMRSRRTSVTEAREAVAVAAAA